MTRPSGHCRVCQKNFWEAGFQRFTAIAVHPECLLSQDVFQTAEFDRRALRLAHATRDRRCGEGTHGERGGFRLSPGLGLVSGLARGGFPVCDLLIGQQRIADALVVAETRRKCGKSGRTRGVTHPSQASGKHPDSKQAARREVSTSIRQTRRQAGPPLKTDC